MAYALVVSGILVNINYFTEVSGGSYAYPVLQNTDSNADWVQAMHRLYGDAKPDARFMGRIRNYSYVVEFFCWVFGRDIGMPMLFNALCYAFSLILIGGIAWQLSESRRMATIAMACAALMCYMMVQATVLLKDSMVVAAMSAIALAWARMGRQRKFDALDFWLLAIGIGIIGFVRANMLLMVGAGALIFALRGIPGRRPVRSWLDARYAWVFLAVVAVFIATRIVFPHTPQVAENIEVHHNTGVFVHHQYVAPWDDMLADDYEDMSIGRRLLWLPASVVVQFLIPFPWNFARDMVFGPTECVAHFGYFWYFAGALFLYWLFAAWKESPESLRRLAVWAILLTAVTAYMTSGRVSRYCLPFLPMILPASAWVLDRCAACRSLWIWLAVFAAFLAPTLIVCHHLQMSA